MYVLVFVPVAVIWAPGNRRVCAPVLLSIFFQMIAKQQDVVCPDPLPWAAARVILIHKTPALCPCPSLSWSLECGLFSAILSSLCITRATAHPLEAADQ